MFHDKKNTWGSYHYLPNDRQEFYRLLTDSSCLPYVGVRRDWDLFVTSTETHFIDT